MRWPVAPQGDCRVKITLVEPESVAEAAGIAVGDELLEVNGKRVMDHIDFRFQESDPEISLRIARNGEVIIFDIEKDDGERIGIDFEEMKILACGNDCIFCFVDQNPAGLRKGLYFRDGDYRLSFMYGNYTTMTNAGPAILRRIIQQRLSPQYISVHVTDLAVRSTLMGLKKDDQILEKIALLHDNGIDMHTQIVLCPGLNDGAILEKTIDDLFRYHKHILSLAIVPVGLTDHRFGLHELQKVDKAYAISLLNMVEVRQKEFRKKLGRNLVYPSDEFFILADRKIPGAAYYDGFPQMENGVGMVRQLLQEFRKQSRSFPSSLESRKRLTLVTAELPAALIKGEILPRLQAIEHLDVSLVVARNTLYGRSVTVAGLLSANCVYSALEGQANGDLVLLPPDIVSASGSFLDDMTPDQLSSRIGAPVMVFEGRWKDVFIRLQGKRRKNSQTLLPIPH